MIYRTAEAFACSEQRMRIEPLVMTSGPFHLIHGGHLSLLRESAQFASRFGAGGLVVCVNGDGFLQRKHGYCAISIEDRLELVDSIKGVAAVFPWDDGTQTVVGALEIVRPDFFMKGGDRTPDTMVLEEVIICESIGCQVKYGVGGCDKKDSSSAIAKRVFSGLWNIRQKSRS